MTDRGTPRIERTPEVEAWLREQLAKPGGHGPIPERARRALASVLGENRENNRTTNSPAGPRDVPGQPPRLMDRAAGETDTHVGAQSVSSTRGGGHPLPPPPREPSTNTRHEVPRSGVA